MKITTDKVLEIRLSSKDAELLENSLQNLMLQENWEGTVRHFNSFLDDEHAAFFLNLLNKMAYEAG